MKKTISSLAAAITATTMLTPSPVAAQDDMQQKVVDAYVFTYPLVMMYRTMYLQAIDADSGVGFGNWLHLGMSSPADTDIVTPNNDTPYSYSWVDLRTEPWVLTMPQIEEDRFYTSQWDDLWGFVLDNPGSVNDGNEGVSVLLAPPDWEGDLPDGIARAMQGETQFLGTLTRTQVIGGADDMENVEGIQASYKLEPLSTFLGTEAPEAEPDVEWMPWGEGDELTNKYWEYVAHLLPFVEPNEQDSAAYENLADLGIVRGEAFDSASLDAEMAEGLQSGIDAARNQLQEWGDNITDAASFFNTREVVGDDYQARATGVYAGIFGNSSDISVYLTVQADANGELLDGSKTAYTITFNDGELPPVKYFWSTTMYQLPSRLLVDNPIDRYSIGSASEGLQTADDGSLTLYIGPESPGADKESNWLPAPSGPFWLVVRNYGPDQSIIDGTYQVPPATPVD
ncbi:DUF1254 domain-containing protein [Falsihalocynthiibacter sp. SS001]|uniref:DUF1254 domain-containing protein n=1 Tax=Falsihalocynthiibacter sp. SS001 TaxID=3349698 RepID=UPI0036D37ABD